MDRAWVNEPEYCFACGRRLARPEFVFLSDTTSGGRHYEVHVGPECFEHVKSAGPSGYQPPLGGPRLYLTSEYAGLAVPS